MTGLIIHHPEPARQGQRLVPVFLPFHGCPQRCMYCSQRLQTGAGQPDLRQVHQKLVMDLETREKRKENGLGLGFFGGTFTALPESWQNTFLDLARRHRKNGLLTHVRCSTRPDRISPAHLSWLASKGLDMVELGVQSFDQEVLRRSGRGYSRQTALEACAMVQHSGLTLGVQLMPGMPGSTMQAWRNDVQQTCALRPRFVRIYPCLVLRGTLLESAYHDRKFRPWRLGRTVWAVGQALLAFWHAGIASARIGLAPEHDLVANIVAGPWHPALGQLARSSALYMHLTSALAALPENAGFRKQITIPKKYSGEFWGHRRALAAAWERVGFPACRVHVWNRPMFCIIVHAVAHSLTQQPFSAKP